MSKLRMVGPKATVNVSICVRGNLGVSPCLRNCGSLCHALPPAVVLCERGGQRVGASASRVPPGAASGGRTAAATPPEMMEDRPTIVSRNAP